MTLLSEKMLKIAAKCEENGGYLPQECSQELLSIIYELIDTRNEDIDQIKHRISENAEKIERIEEVHKCNEAALYLARMFIAENGLEDEFREFVDIELGKLGQFEC